VAEAVASGGAGADRAILRFDRVQVPVHPLCVRIFLNERGATADTPVPRPTFAGTFTLLPIGAPDSGNLARRVTIQTEVSAHVAALIRRRAQVEVTMVPMPLRGRTLPRDPLRIEGVTLTLDG
jgi:hypothetical protein